MISSESVGAGACAKTRCQCAASGDDYEPLIGHFERPSRASATSVIVKRKEEVRVERVYKA